MVLVILFLLWRTLVDERGLESRLPQIHVVFGPLRRVVDVGVLLRHWEDEAAVVGSIGLGNPFVAVEELVGEEAPDPSRRKLLHSFPLDPVGFVRSGAPVVELCVVKRV